MGDETFFVLFLKRLSLFVSFFFLFFFFVNFVHCLSLVWTWRSLSQPKQTLLFNSVKVQTREMLAVGSGVRADSPIAYVTRCSHTVPGSGDRQTDRLEY